MTLKSWLSRHAQTLIGSLGRIVHQPTGALLTMAVIGVALALPLFLTVFLDNSRAATANLNQGFDISVYLKKQAARSRAPALAELWRRRSDVASVRVIPADAALVEFRQRSGFGAALDALTDNPLPDTLVVTPALSASTPSGVAALEQVLTASDDVDTVQVDSAWVNRLTTWLDILRRIVWLAAALLGLAVVLVVGNTIRLDILNRRSEIEVMKLVGATDGFARRPFLYSGVWYGLGGGGIAVSIVAIATRLLTQPVNTLAGLYGSDFRLHGMTLTAALGVLGVAVTLSWLGSWLAASRHIRAIEPT
jgi:cell division transport system permease protein